MPKRTLPSLPTLALEVFSIVLGVLLALALSEWAEEREHQSLASSALVNVTQEINSNLETLILIHDNNVETIETLKASVDSDENRNIIPGLQLQETAWEALIASGLSSYVEYDTLLALSATYSLQGVYKHTATQLVDAVMSATAHSVALGTVLDDRHLQEQFMGYFELLIQIEAQLLDAYRDTLDSFDS